MLVTVQTGLRVSELITLRRDEIHLGAGAHVACHGKGRKDRITPLTKPAVQAMCSWLDESSGTPTDPVFPTRTGRSLSRDAIERRLTRHHATAARMCPSLNGKHITAHALRHTVAVRLLEAGVDTTVIALARTRTRRHHRHLPARHLDIKEKALARIAPAHTEPGRYHPPDALLAFLEGL
jgi:integrase/recombinase XerD